jgi:inner membrane protein
VLAALPLRLARAALLAALAASVLIDVDHLPGVLGSDALIGDAPRPYSHSLLTPTLLLAVGALARGVVRLVALGAAAGVALHLVRDLAGPPGVALDWPLSSESVSYPVALYLALMVAAALRAWTLR